MGLHQARMFRTRGPAICVQKAVFLLQSVDVFRDDAIFSSQHITLFSKLQDLVLQLTNFFAQFLS